MAQLKDVFEVEKNRKTVEDCMIIHLFQEGAFYRAYEMSAWLCFRYINQFKATHRKLKTETDTLVFVGFPITSLERYMTEAAEIVLQEDKRVDIKLSADYFNGYESVDRLNEDYNNWKMCVPIIKGSSSKGDVENNSTDVSELMKKISLFPIENKTPIECMIFLSEIKQQIMLNKNMVNS